MKQFLVILTLFLGLLKTNAQTDEKWFVTEWDVNLPSQGQLSSGANTITFKVGGTTSSSRMQYRTTIGTGSWSTATVPAAGTHIITAGADGKVEVRLYGIRNFSVNYSGSTFTDAYKLKEVKQWGTGNPWNTAYQMFYNAVNMDVSATDSFIFSGANMNGMFRNCSSLVGNSSFANWNVSSVSGMQSMFDGATLFSQDISNWNVGAINVKYMFRNACHFNPDFVQNWTAGSSSNSSNNTNWLQNAGNCLLSQNPANWFVTVWDTTIAGDNNSGDSSIKILISGTESTKIQYQEANTTTPDQWIDVPLSAAPSATEYTTISFPQSGQYRVRISPSVVNFHSYVDISGVKKSEAYKLLKVEQWGAAKWSSLRSMFYDAINMDVVATDTPDLSNTNIDATNMFYNTTSLVGNSSFSNWSTANIKSMEAMFYKAPLFNQPIGSWNTQNVTSMESMFYDALAFNQPIGSWNTSNVTTMKQMFNGAVAFNQPINTWNTSKVTNMESMFNGAKVFNQPLNNWNVALVTTMAKMFYGASEFNQDLNNWQTTALKNIAEMFYEAKKFNGEVGTFNTSLVTNMSRTFYGASEFNKPIGSWDTSNVTTFNRMFYEAEKFNQPIGSWNTGKVTNMESMFQRARAFNQPIGTWNTSKVTTMRLMFSEAGEFNQDIGSWNTSLVTNTEFMFFRAAKFNQYIGNWDTSKITTMRRMFYVATRYNQSMANWNISSVENFEDALSYSNLSPYNLDATLYSWKTQTLSPNLPVSTGGVARKLISADGLTNIRYCNQENIDAMVAKGFEMQVTQKCGEIGLTYLETPNDMAASHKLLVGVKKTNGVDSQGKPLGAFEWLEEYDGIADTSEDLGMTKMFDDKVYSYSKGERDNLKEFPNDPSFTQKRYPLANLSDNSGAYNVEVINQTEQVDGQSWELGKVVFDPVKNHFYQGTNQGWERIDN